MTATEQSMNAGMSQAQPHPFPPLDFILRAGRIKDTEDFVHANSLGIRLSPQPRRQSDDDFLISHLGFLPPTKTRPRARAWILAAITAHLAQARLRQMFLDNITRTLERLSRIA